MCHTQTCLQSRHSGFHLLVANRRAPWGSSRLDALDRSRLEAEIGRAGRAEVIAATPARPGRFDVGVEGIAVRFDEVRVHEPVLLRLPRGRAPPQGAVLHGVAQVAKPRAPSNGFDEATWLRHRGIHVVLRMSHFDVIGRRGGIGGVADALHRRLQRSVARGVTGERAAVLEGVLLGEENGLSDELRARFRAAGLYHPLRKSRVSSGRVVVPSGQPGRDDPRESALRLSLRFGTREHGKRGTAS